MNASKVTKYIYSFNKSNKLELNKLLIYIYMNSSNYLFSWRTIQISFHALYYPADASLDMITERENEEYVTCQMENIVDDLLLTLLLLLLLLLLLFTLHA